MTTTDLVTVPREPTDEMIRAGVAARWFVDNDEGKPANVRNSWEAMIAAAPPAASVRAKEVTNLEIATAFHEAYERLAPRYGYETRPESRKPFSDLPNELKLLMVAVVREVRTLLAPAVDERAASSEAAVVVAKVDCGDAEQLSARITEYLRGGGLWNPECANHDNVRKLLIDCRNAFDAAIADHAIKAAIAQVDAARTEGKGNG